MELLKTGCTGILLLMTLLSFQQLEMTTILDFMCALSIGGFMVLWIVSYARSAYIAYLIWQYGDEDEDYE